MEPNERQAGRGRVVAQPAEGEFVPGDEHDDGVGGGVPVLDDAWMHEGELDCCVNGLTSLGARRKVVTGHHIEAGD